MPVWLLKGAGLREPPAHTQYGDLFLLQPIVPLWLGGIPGNGVLSVTRTVPMWCVEGETYHFQSLLGPLSGVDTWTRLQIAE